MFGFLQSHHHHREYRQAYARCCRLQHREFGVLTLPLLSYEAVFLYLLATDAKLCPSLAGDDPVCCRLRMSAADASAVDARLGRFCASVGLLLTRVKLDDDVRDERSLAAGFARWMLRAPIAKALQCLEELSPCITNRMAALVERHLRLERDSAHVTLAEYVQPTAEGFGEVFALLPAVFPQAAGGADERFREIGRSIGAAIVAYDAAVDWHRDHRQRRFNPLPDESAAREAIGLAAEYLAAAGWRCVEEFHPRSQAARVLHHVYRRVIETRIVDRRETWTARFRRWNFLREPGYVYAGDCACDCPAGCEGGCCDSGCCDSGTEAGGCAGDTSGGENASACYFVPCPCECCFCYEPNQRAKSASSRTQSRRSPFVGMTGRATAELNPTGGVEIGGRHFPARSDGPAIPTGTEIVVLEETEFGFVVRPIPATGTTDPQ